MGAKGHVNCPLSLFMKSKTEKCTFCNTGSFDYIRVPAVFSRPLSPPCWLRLFWGKGSGRKEKRSAFDALWNARIESRRDNSFVQHMGCFIV